MNKRVDFSENAPVYDRRHGAVLPPEVARSLALEARLTEGARVLDVGAGTGRVAYALADLGCDVVALDPALPMLDELKRKASTRRVRAVVGEGARVPFAKHTFEAAVAARILYLLADWRAVLREARDALKPGGYLLHEWGNGSADEEWVDIREKLRALFQLERSRHAAATVAFQRACPNIGESLITAASRVHHHRLHRRARHCLESASRERGSVSQRDATQRLQAIREQGLRDLEGCQA